MNNDSGSTELGINLQDIGFANEPVSDSAVDKQVAAAVNLTSSGNFEVNPFIMEAFRDPILFKSLPTEIKDNAEALSEYIKNMTKFKKLIDVERSKRANGTTADFLGEEVEIPETAHHNGEVRRAESGYRLNVDYLTTAGIDPEKVLFFRLTQPMGDIPKPEYYWTSDYFETKYGLNAEIPLTQRQSAIILVASLEEINKNGGLIQDVNDDSGIAVRQIGTGGFNQRKCIAIPKAI